MLRALLIGLSIVLFSSVSATTVLNTANGKLYIPYIQAGQQVFEVELDYVPETGSFAVAQLRQRQHDTVPVYGQALTLSPEGMLQLPRLEVDGSLFQVTLRYQPADNTLSIDEVQPVTDADPQRGTLLSTTASGSYSQLQISQLIALTSLSSPVPLNLTANNGVSLYTLTYQTLDPAGTLTTASALLALPDGATSPRPLVALQHGTQVNDAAIFDENRSESLLLAAAGYVVVAADYLGFGQSTGLHPYIHAHSLATSVVDALRAARTAAQQQGLSLNGQVFLAGYSEGGYATLAAQRELESLHRDEFQLTASAAMAGPYDLSGTMVQRVLDSTPHPSPYYFPYLLLALQQVYGLLDGLSEGFAAPYDSGIASYFDGSHSDAEINAYLPASHQAIFQAQFSQDLSNPDSRLSALLRANDLLRWKPQTATRLYHCVKDDQVPFANSQNAYDSFQALGATQVALMPVEDDRYDQSDAHANCAIPIMLMAKTWFDSLVQ